MASVKLFFFQILSALFLWTESLARAFWRLLCWVFLFCGLWLFQIPQSFGQIFAVLTSVVFIGGVFYFLYKDARKFDWPGLWRIFRRIETDSGVKHRPLSSQNEHLANKYSNDAIRLWEKNKEYLASSLGFLHRPYFRMDKDRDPLGLRFATILFFGFGVIYAGAGWPQRLAHGIFPLSVSTQGSAENLQFTIVPPSYTNLETLYLGKDDSNKFIKIPEGSMVRALVQGGFGKPSLKINDNKVDLLSEDQKTYLLELPIPNITSDSDHGSLTIQQLFIKRARWGYETVYDAAPKISKNGDHEIVSDTLIRLPLIVEDDYSVESITIEMEIDPIVEQAPLGNKTSEIRSVMSPAGKPYEIAPVLDYTSHTWAGLPVILKIAALDHLGHKAELEPIPVILPEKIFEHPVAKKLIAMRKELIWDPVMDTKPMATLIEELMFNPSAFHGDLVVFLALRSASARLYWNEPSVENTKTVIDLLWDTAMAIEEGNLSLAMRNLRDSQNALERALRNPEISQAEISELMNEMRQAMAEYMNEIQRELQKRMESGDPVPLVPPEALSQIIDPGVIENFLNQLEQEMRAGNKDKVQEMLSQLQDMMDNMGPQMAEMPEDMQMMQNGVNELQQLIERQEELLAQTQGQIQQPVVPQDFGDLVPLEEDVLKELGLQDLPPPPVEAQSPKIDTSKNKAEQEALRLVLGKLMLDASEVLKQIPENMGFAEQEMRNSSTFLGENKPQDSIPHQEEAIKNLKETQQKLSQQFMTRMKQMGGMMLSRGQRYDPLGRPYGEGEEEGGMYPGSQVKIPNEAEQKRALEILRELRRRSSQRDRPEQELEYYRRLLKQF